MRKVIAVVSLALLLTPSAAFADSWKHRRPWHRPRTVVIRERHHYDGAAIAAGVLGGLVTGVILDRVLVSAPPPPQPVYYPPPPRPVPRDPYDEGYSDGYGQGVERGRRERYEQGRRRGYEEGYEDSRAGRAF
ncbi:MAG: hypothetical protein HYY46_12305 [Deltaproteobacteria bacterium]|nr:hypothetical protein [Deltaproteobacteria bacterium]